MAGSRSASETSSVMYDDHEPFETYRDKVAALCRVLWPGHDDADFTIERMQGGSSNRIIGIRVAAKEPESDSPLAAPDEGSALHASPPESIAVANLDQPDQLSDRNGVKNMSPTPVGSESPGSTTPPVHVPLNEPNEIPGPKDADALLHTLHERSESPSVPCPLAGPIGLEQPPTVEDKGAVPPSPKTSEPTPAPHPSANSIEPVQLPSVKETTAIPAPLERSGLPPAPCPSSDPIEPEQPPDTQRAASRNLAPGDYVLRIPRFQPSSPLMTDINLVNLAGKFFTTNLPQTVHFDTTSGPSNPLDAPYALQPRIPGKRVDEVWEDLTHNQRLCIAQDLARFYKEVQCAMNPSGGVPDFDPVCATKQGKEEEEEKEEEGVPGVPTMDFPFIGDVDGQKVALPPVSAVKMLRTRFTRWRAFYGDGVPRYRTPWLTVAAAVDAMQQLNGTWEHGPRPTFFLHHGDLFPRNIMVTLDDESDSACVSGILDWDGAHFAPAVVAFAPPAWLWVEEYWADSDDDEEGDGGGAGGFIGEDKIWSVAGRTPEDAGARGIKAAFDDIVGEEFRKYAYGPDAEVARKIWSAANERISKTWIVTELMELTREWFAKLDVVVEGTAKTADIAEVVPPAPPSEDVSVNDGPLSINP